jgi:hypothetical protein
MPNLNMPDEGGARPPVQPMMPKKDMGGMVRIIVIVLVVLVLGGGGYWMYQSGNIPFLSKKKATPSPPPVTMEILPQETQPEMTAAATATTPPPGADAMAGKPDMKQPMGPGKYILVIGSFLDQTIAEAEAGRWSKAGFHAMVSPKTSKGTTWYRVALGGYEDRKAASKAGKEMEHMFEAGYWVDRAE